MTAVGLDALIVVASSVHGPEGHLGLARGGVRANDEHDHLADARAAREFLGTRHEFAAPAGPPSTAELRRLRLLRDAVRSLVRGDVRSYVRRRDALLRGARYRLAPGGAPASPPEGGAEVCGPLLAPLLALRGGKRRLPACGHPRRGWVVVGRSPHR